MDRETAGLCVRLAKIFQIEELAESVLIDDSDAAKALERLEGQATVALRKESLQFFRVVRLSSGYMLFLTVIYLI